MDTTYRVVIDLATTGSLGKTLDDVGSKTAGIEGAFRNLTGAAGEIGKSLSDAFTGAVERAGSLVATMGKLAGVAAIGGATYGVVSLNNELEKTQIGLSTVFTMFGATPDFTSGLELAADTMSKMRTDAAKLPGEFKDLKQFFSLGLSPGLQSGKSVDDLRQMASGAMAAAAALQVPMDQAAREYGMLLSGRAGAHNIFGAKLGLTGDAAQRFNKESAADRASDLGKKLNSPAIKSAIDAYATSFDGLSSTLIDSGKKFLGSATSGLFESVKGTMMRANTWIDANSAKLDAMAHSLSDKLAAAWSAGVDAVERWWPAVKTFALDAYHELAGIWTKLEPLVSRFGDSLRSSLGDGSALDKIKGTLEMYAALKFGAPMLGAMMPGGGASSGLLDALGAGSAGLAVSGPLAGAALVGLAAAATGLYGAIDDLTDANNKYYAGATHDWQMAIIDLQAANKDLSIAFGGAGDAFKELSQWMGSNLLAEIHVVTNGISRMAAGVNTLSDAVKGSVFYKLLAGDDKMGTFDKSGRGGEVIGGGGFERSAYALAAERAAKERSRTTPPSAQTNVNIGRVEIVVSGNAEPSRVARGIFSEMSNMARNPKVSRFVKNYSSDR